MNRLLGAVWSFHPAESILSPAGDAPSVLAVYRCHVWPTQHSTSAWLAGLSISLRRCGCAGRSTNRKLAGNASLSPTSSAIHWTRASPIADSHSRRARACLRRGNVKRGVFRLVSTAGCAIGIPRKSEIVAEKQCDVATSKWCLQVASLVVYGTRK